MRVLALLTLLLALSACADYCDTYDGYYCELSLAQPALVAPASNVKSLNGVWNILLDIDNAKCPFIPGKLSAPVTLKESGNNLSISIPGKGELRGTRNSSRATLRGTYQLKPYPCSAAVTSNVTQIRKNSAKLSATINMSCNGRPLCSAKGSGSLRRN